MPKFCANLSMLYTEHAFLDRFAAAAADGFTGVEYIGPYDYPEVDVAAALTGAGQTQVLFNLPAGDWAGGERGIGCLPDRVEEFQVSVEIALRYAAALGCTQINCLAGIAPVGANQEELEAVLISNLKYAAPRMAAAGVKLLLEPINTRDIPGFFLSRVDHALRIIEAVRHENLWLQYDFYHAQIMQGDLIPTFERHQSRIAHVQIADHPGRHEPGTGEINHSYLLQSLDRLAYDGWVGCEYKPRTSTSAGLGWMKEMGVKA
ncbi:2-oxo-tetronate isomerase [Falsihalocynthiibacter arcticus]|uniref:Hydroxypyruvate isomerase n=1 Tax=Falsihalocynthiibacter arcticus TaxID=1579316 RepID=A0A126V2P2_9RHOB|nr:2-oxo-tetronate isomerase [Falsihalocynthiibacter arcticus]AML52601.1 hydroxypyruvate isomerase [Falsihalocynthiibacter arcticus]